MYNNLQKSYCVIGLYAHKPYISNNFKATVFKNPGSFHCEEYGYEKNFIEIMGVTLSNFFTRRIKMFSRFDAFILYVELGVELFSNFELLDQNMKVRP